MDIFEPFFTENASKGTNFTLNLKTTVKSILWCQNGTVSGPIEYI